MDDSQAEMFVPKELLFVEYLSYYLDSCFHITIPILNKRKSFGFDALIGLVPVLGDLISFSISILILVMIWRHGIPKFTLFRMIGNITLDVVIGSIPFIGDIFDFFFKANKRNWKLLSDYYKGEAFKRQQQASSV